MLQSKSVSLSEIQGGFDVKIQNISDEQLTISVDKLSYEEFDTVQFLTYSEKSKITQYLEVIQSKDHCYTLDLSVFRELAEYKHMHKFRLLMQCTKNNSASLYDFNICNNAEASYEGDHIFMKDIYFPQDTEETPAEYIGILTAVPKGSLFITLCSRQYYLKTAYSCELRRISMKKDHRIVLQFELNTGSCKYNRTLLIFRNKLAEDAVNYEFETITAESHNGRQQVTVSLSLDKIVLKSLYWDVRVEFYDPETNICNLLPVHMNKVQRMYHKFIYNKSFGFSDDFFFYPYYTAKQTLAFAYREKGKYDDTNIIWKEMLALFLYRLGKKYWKKQHICLVCEKYSEMAQDNGYYFFKHCMDENEEEYLNKKIYYVIAKDSPHRAKLKPYSKNVLDFMSIRHMCYILAADLIVSSESKNHIFAIQSRHSNFYRYIKKIPFVFLQHGVIALKKVDFFYGKGKRGGCDLFVVSTNAEKRTVMENFGYDDSEVINTGLPRWDVLKDNSQNSREILIMPTWRNWLDSIPDEDFENSEYFIRYMELLNSEKFHSILEKYDIHANFYLHAKFQQYTEIFQTKNDRIHLLSFGKVPVNEMLMKCKMLITDYSSVCWDILYQNKPSLFYQFDLSKYEEAHGSYIDMRTELFGDRAENLEQLLYFLEQEICNGFAMKPKYEEKRREYFQFTDQQHSRHICEEIKKHFK